MSRQAVSLALPESMRETIDELSAAVNNGNLLSVDTGARPAAAPPCGHGLR